MRRLMISMIVVLCSLGVHGVTPQAVEAIDQLVRSEMKKHSIVGLSIALVSDQGILWSGGYGYSDLEKKIPMTPQTLLRVGSVGKLMTATAVMLLVERGEVDLDASVAVYLPEFSLLSRWDQGSQSITIRDLLSHRGGLPRDLYKDYQGQEPVSLESLLDELAEVHLVRRPGERVQYTNLGYSILGLVIERVSGMAYEQFLTMELLQPLGMTQTRLSLAGGVPQLAQGYTSGPGFLRRAQKAEAVEGRDQPAGSLISSAQDLASYLQFVLREGVGPDDQRLLGGARITSMYDIWYDLDVLDEDPFGLGWKVNKGQIGQASLVIEHGGTQDGYSSVVVALPHEKLGVVVVYNTNQVVTRHYIANKALELVLGSTAPQTPVSSGLSPDEFLTFQGRYVAGVDTPLIVDLFWEKGPRIRLGGQEFPLVASKHGGLTPVKKICLIPVPIARFMGYDDLRLDIVIGPDGRVYPALFFHYRNLVITMLLENVQPYHAPELNSLVGRYQLSQMSLPHVHPGTVGEIALDMDEGWLMARIQMRGQEYQVLLLPIGDSLLAVAGSGDVVRYGSESIEYSGLHFVRVK